MLVGERASPTMLFFCLHLFCLTLITGKDGPSLRRSLTRTWESSPNRSRTLEGRSRTIRFSPRMRESLHISSPLMIGELPLLLMGPATTILTKIRPLGTPIRTWIDTHLGQKPKLGGRYADTALISISCCVGTLYIHVFVLFLVFVLLCFCFLKTQKDQKYFCCFSLVCLFFSLLWFVFPFCFV